VLAVAAPRARRCTWWWRCAAPREGGLAAPRLRGGIGSNAGAWRRAWSGRSPSHAGACAWAGGGLAPEGQLPSARPRPWPPRVVNSVHGFAPSALSPSPLPKAARRPRNATAWHSSTASQVAERGRAERTHHASSDPQG